MTIEQRTLIPLQDISAIEFECENCHATYSIPLAGLKANEMGFSCINCPQQFANPLHTNSAEMSDLHVLQSFLLRLRDAQQRKYKATIRLVIPASPEAKKSIARGASPDSGGGT